MHVLKLVRARPCGIAITKEDYRVHLLFHHGPQRFKLDLWIQATVHDFQLMPEALDLRGQ